MSVPRLPDYFLSHGAGQWSYMAGAFRQQIATLEQSLIETGRELAHALLVMSGGTSGIRLHPFDQHKGVPA
jgi:hypothetical protein